jgi:hypothetical protein
VIFLTETFNAKKKISGIIYFEAIILGLAVATRLSWSINIYECPHEHIIGAEKGITSVTIGQLKQFMKRLLKIAC